MLKASAPRAYRSLKSAPRTYGCLIAGCCIDEKGPLRVRIVPPIAVVAEFLGIISECGRNSAPKAPAAAFPESIRPLRWAGAIEVALLPTLVVGEGRRRSAAGPAAELVSCSAYVSFLQSLLWLNFLELLMSAGEIQPQRRPLPLFRNRFVRSAGLVQSRWPSSPPWWWGRGEGVAQQGLLLNLLVAPRTYRSSNRCCG